METPIFKQETSDIKYMNISGKLRRYYKGDFLTDYTGPRVQQGKQLKDVLKTDNLIARSVNRYASSVIGKYCSVEFDNKEFQDIIDSWAKKVKLSDKFTTIARYQSLCGGAVVKVLFKFPDANKNEDGTYNLSGMKVEELLACIDLAVFGMDKASISYDDYNNLESISIILGNKAEVFYSDRIEFYTTQAKGSNNWQYQKTVANSLPVPLAYFIPNIELGTDYLSDVADIVPLQEALNNALTQHNNNVTFHGTPQWYAKGLPAPVDENGNPTFFRFGAGQVLHSEDKDAEFGKIQVEGIEPTAIDAYTKQISLATYSLSLLTGTIPSGEALVHLSKDFNAIVAEKQSKIIGFLEYFFSNLLKMIDVLIDVDYQGEKFKVFVAGYNPLQEQRDFNEAFQLYSANALSLKTLLDTSDVVNNTAEELERISEEKNSTVEESIGE